MVRVCREARQLSTRHQPLCDVRRPRRTTMLASVRQDDDDRPIGKNSSDAAAARVAHARVHQFSDPPVPDIDARAITVMNLERWLATDMHERRFELPTFRETEKARAVDRRNPPIDVSCRATHSIRALVSPIPTLKASRPHARWSQQLPVYVLFPGLS